jgi:hypothetical protein
MKTFLGFGQYLGDFDSPELRQHWARQARKFGHPDLARAYEDAEIPVLNPRIKLDNGDIIWGYECWWGSADDFIKYGKAKKYGVSAEAEQEAGRTEAKP